LYCKICDKLVISKNKYDIFHKELVCLSCIETHHISNETTADELMNLVPKESGKKKSFMPTAFIAIGIIYTFYVLFDSLSYNYYGDHTTFYEWLLLVCILFGMAKIIRLIEKNGAA